MCSKICVSQKGKLEDEISMVCARNSVRNEEREEIEYKRIDLMDS